MSDKIRWRYGDTNLVHAAVDFSTARPANPWSEK